MYIYISRSFIDVCVSKEKPMSTRILLSVCVFFFLLRFFFRQKQNQNAALRIPSRYHPFFFSSCTSVCMYVFFSSSGVICALMKRPSFISTKTKPNKIYHCYIVQYQFCLLARIKPFFFSSSSCSMYVRVCDAFSSIYRSVWLWCMRLAIPWKFVGFAFFFFLIVIWRCY